MNVSLREITPENFNECVNLKVAKGQEKFVASNVFSIAQSKIYHPQANIFAVYAGDVMVGFVMFGLDGEDGRYYLGRLMIGEKHQGKGYGKAATLEVIERLKQIENCREVYLCCSPENINAETLYAGVGFERTGEIYEGEVVMRLDLRKSTDNRSLSADN